MKQECLEEVINVQTTNSDLEDEDDTNKSRSSSVITAKEALSLLDRVHLFDTYNEGDGSLQRAIEDIITTVEGITTRSKKQTSIKKFFHAFYNMFILRVQKLKVFLF